MSNVDKGCVNRDKLIQECIDQPKHFQDKITRNKLSTFASEGNVTG